MKQDVTVLPFGLAQGKLAQDAGESSKEIGIWRTIYILIDSALVIEKFFIFNLPQFISGNGGYLNILFWIFKSS